MKNRQDVDRKFFLLFILWNAGNVLRTGTGGVTRFYFSLSFHCLCTGKIPLSFWGATGAGSSLRDTCSSGSWARAVLCVGLTWITSDLGAACACQHSTLSSPRRLSAARWDASLELSCCSGLPCPHPATGTRDLCTPSCLLYCQNGLF